MSDPEKRSRCLFGTGCIFFTHTCHFSSALLYQVFRCEASSGAQLLWIPLHEKKTACLPMVLGNSNRALCCERGEIFHVHVQRFLPQHPAYVKECLLWCENDAGNNTCMIRLRNSLSEIRKEQAPAPKGAGACLESPDWNQVIFVISRWRS